MPWLFDQPVVLRAIALNSFIPRMQLPNGAQRGGSPAAIKITSHTKPLTDMEPSPPSSAVAALSRNADDARSQSKRPLINALIFALRVAACALCHLPCRSGLDMYTLNFGKMRQTIQGVPATCEQ
jgi:hypothetical protein